MDGLKGGAGGGGGMDDLFSMFTGMGGRGGGQPQKKRVKPIARQIDVTLADIYNGKTVELNLERQRICAACDGKGGTDETAVQTCSGCKGRGMRTTMRQMGPGMYSQSTGPCDECGGQGEKIDMEKRCKTCKGKKVVRDKKTLTVEVDKGAPDKE
jgi:DnaJ family protein A protein 2